MGMKRKKLQKLTGLRIFNNQDQVLTLSKTDKKVKQSIQADNYSIRRMEQECEEIKNVNHLN